MYPSKTSNKDLHNDPSATAMPVTNYMVGDGEETRPDIMCSCFPQRKLFQQTCSPPSFRFVCITTRSAPNQPAATNPATAVSDNFYRQWRAVAGRECWAL